MRGVLAGKKTYVTAALAILGALAGYLTGDLGTDAAVQLAVTALLGAFIRAGVKTETVKAELNTKDAIVAAAKAVAKKL
jgi:hypothetical protein